MFGLFKKKCCLCNYSHTDEVVIEHSRVQCKYGYYVHQDVPFNYHKKCLYQILDNPYDFKPPSIKMAYKIISLVEAKQELEAIANQEYYNLCAKLLEKRKTFRN